MLVKMELDLESKKIGRSARNRKLGGWRSSAFLIGSVGLSFVAFGGLFPNLVLYFVRVWKQGNATAANNVTNILGTFSFVSVLGAIIGDAYWGRLWTTAVFQGVSVLGGILLGLVTTLWEPANGESALELILIFLSFYVIALGLGSYEPVLASLGADQLDTPREKAMFFNWLFIIAQLGELPSLTVLTYLENGGKWALGFWISCGSMAVGLLILLLGVPYYRHSPATGNPYLRVIQVLVCAIRKFNLKLPREDCTLYEASGEESIIPGSRKISHRDKYRWLDKAAALTGEDLATDQARPSAWHLCTVTQVEEVKCLLGLWPLFIISVLYALSFSQMATLFVEQGAAMDNKIGKAKFKIPPASMAIVSIVSAAILSPTYDHVLVPWLKQITGNPKGMSSTMRMGCGLVVMIAAMGVAGVVEMKRLGDNNLSILWQVPQYALWTLAAVFFVVGQLDFFYTEVSDSMRSLGTALTVVSRGVGYYASSALLDIVTAITTRGDSVGWLPPQDLNKGHLDYLYWTLAIIGIINFFLFLIFASRYQYLTHLPHRDNENDTVPFRSPTHIAPP